MNIEHTIDVNDILGKLEIVIAENNALKEEVKNLKCCGNCTYFYDNVCSKDPTIDVEYCDKWESDTLTQEDRK